MQAQADHAGITSGPVCSTPVRMERLTLITVVGAEDWVVELPRVIAVQTGEDIWVNGDSLLVRHRDGTVTAHQGDGYWHCGRARVQHRSTATHRT